MASATGWPPRRIAAGARRHALLPLPLSLAGLVLLGPLAALQPAAAADAGKPPASAADAAPKSAVTASGLLAVAVQCQLLGEADGAPDGCGAGATFQPVFDYTPNDRWQVHVNLGIGAGNGVNDTTPFAVQPWSADLADETFQINGRDRSLILTAWGKHTVPLGPGRSLALTGGIIDASDYVDRNAYANDEYGQFMNSIFVNLVDTLAASYDYGAVARLDLGALALTGIVMNVGENDDGHSYTFFAGESELAVKNRLGDGTVRLMVLGTTPSFEPADGGEDLVSDDLVSQVSVSLSADHAIGEHLGVFFRGGWQSKNATVDFPHSVTGGVQLDGGLWGRTADVVGLGYGYLFGGNTGIRDASVIEAYYKAAVRDDLAITADVQFLSEVVAPEGPSGVILGLRGVFSW